MVTQSMSLAPRMKPRAGNYSLESIRIDSPIESIMANRKTMGFDSAVVTLSCRVTFHSIQLFRSSKNIKADDTPDFCLMCHQPKKDAYLNVCFYFLTYVAVHLQLIPKK